MRLADGGVTLEKGPVKSSKSGRQVLDGLQWDNRNLELVKETARCMRQLTKLDSPGLSVHIPELETHE